jgi:dipeptidyl aminopeptidase/acylaminoacyl peptidase
VNLQLPIRALLPATCCLLAVGLVSRPLAAPADRADARAVASGEIDSSGDAAWTPEPEPEQPDEVRASPQRTPREEGPRLVFRDRVVAYWEPDHRHFWYRNDLRGGRKEFILVEAEAGERRPAFDHNKLATSLAAAAGTTYDGEKLPFDQIDFTNGVRTVRFRVADVNWECDLSDYKLRRSEAKAGSASPDSPDPTTPSNRGGRASRDADGNAESPDGRWTAFLREHNVWVRPREGTGPERQLSADGTSDLAYGRISWSPDSQMVVAFRIEPGDRKEVYLVESSPRGGGRAKLRSRPYPLPGDKFAKYELNVFQLSDAKQLKPVVDRFEHEWLAPRLHWKKDNHTFSYQLTDRGHQRLRVLEVDGRSGRTRNLIDERTRTFIWTAHTENLRLDLVTWLERTDELLYVSESNGWRHLYLVDGEAGRLKNAVTQGEWVLRGVDRIDETNRQVWFRASGVFPRQDPYLMHYGRVNFDGTGLVFLTDGDGNHSGQYSPDYRYLIDTFSRMDAPPVTELRRMDDGRRVCELERADTRDLEATGRRAPEVFVAKGRDGKTDIWGILCRPAQIDPGRKYPVIEDIYAGPQGSFVPKSFATRPIYESLTKLGFVVVKIDGMGTANRSKAFHDACWQNLKDAGFEDRILWMKAAEKKYPYLDLTRVGIYGTSAGGQNAAAAVLFHPEFYKAAVANCGCHDNRMDKASWNEQWMGYPVGPQYAECSNIENAGRLQGHLFLIVGELDDNVPPESTYRLVDALIKAGKDFDLLVVPSGGHGAGGNYASRRREDFFIRHLLGKEPPERNHLQPDAPSSGTSP